MAHVPPTDTRDKPARPAALGNRQEVRQGLVKSLRMQHWEHGMHETCNSAVNQCQWRGLQFLGLLAVTPQRVWRGCLVNRCCQRDLACRKIQYCVVDISSRSMIAIVKLDDGFLVFFLLSWREFYEPSPTQSPSDLIIGS